MTRRRAPRSAANAIRTVRERSAPQTPLAAVQAVWASTVGEQVAAVTTPVSERDGVVVVSCAESVWAQELDLMQEQVLERLRLQLGDRAPRGLRFQAH